MIITIKLWDGGELKTNNSNLTIPRKTIFRRSLDCLAALMGENRFSLILAGPIMPEMTMTPELTQNSIERSESIQGLITLIFVILILAVYKYIKYIEKHHRGVMKNGPF